MTLVQGIIMLFGIVAVIAAVLNGQGGFMEAVSKMAQIPSDVPATMGQPGAFTAFFGPDPLNLLGVVILTSLGTWGLPQMIGKFYAIKDEKSISTRNSDLYTFCYCDFRRMLFPGGIWKTI